MDEPRIDGDRRHRDRGRRRWATAVGGDCLDDLDHLRLDNVLAEHARSSFMRVAGGALADLPRPDLCRLSLATWPLGA